MASRARQGNAPRPPPPPPPALASRTSQSSRPVPPPPPPLPTFRDLDIVDVPSSAPIAPSVDSARGQYSMHGDAYAAPSSAPPLPRFSAAYSVPPPPPPPEYIPDPDENMQNPPRRTPLVKRAPPIASNLSSARRSTPSDEVLPSPPPPPPPPVIGTKVPKPPSLDSAQFPRPPPAPFGSGAAPRPPNTHLQNASRPSSRIPEPPVDHPRANGHAAPALETHHQTSKRNQRQHQHVGAGHFDEQPGQKSRRNQSRRQQPQKNPTPRQQTTSGPHIVVPENLTPDSADVTPAHLMAMACEQLDWWRIVTLAREYGESVSSVHAGEERLTALHHAVLDDKPEYAYQLAVQYGAPTNAIDVYGDTPLISAVQNCRYTIVHMLVRDAKADVTIIGRFGLTALHWCSEMNSTSEATRCAELLLSRGADVGVEDEAGKTPLHWAALCGKPQLSELLLGRGGMATIDVRDAAGRTALFNAADKGHDAIVRSLLQRGASAIITDVNGVSPYEAARRSGNSDCAKLLKKFKNVKHSGPAMPVDIRLAEREKHAHSNFVRAANCVDVPDPAVLGTGGLSDNISANSWDDAESARSKSTKSSSKHSAKTGSKCTIQ